MTGPGATRAVFVVAAGDNVGIAGRRIAAGETVEMADGTLIARDDVPLAHKIALVAIPAAGKVVRCGVPIGSATRAILPGEHVHTHNLVSDYIPTYTLDGPLRFAGSAP